MLDRPPSHADAHAHPAPRGLFELRVLERTLGRRLDALDARLQALAASGGSPTDRHVSDVDVLCAAILEAAELLDATRMQAAAEVQQRRGRRAAARRWA